MEIFENIGNLLIMATAAMVLVFIAMSIDLASGLYKAKSRGEVHTSQALKRSITKFISYIGGLIIATCMDILINASHLWDIIGLDILMNKAVITIIIGVFLLAVEFLSVREKADQKTKNQMNNVAEALGEILSNPSTKRAFGTMVQREIERRNKIKDTEEHNEE